MMRIKDFAFHWKIDDVDDFYKALKAFDLWERNSKKTGVDLTTKEIITKKLPKLYNGLTTGDKIRVGRAISNRFKSNCYRKIDDGPKKGASRTYHIK